MVAHVIMSQSAGWPIHAFDALRILANSPEAGLEIAEALRSDLSLRRIVQVLEGPLDGRVLDGLRQLATLDRFPPEVAVVLLGREHYESLRRQGFRFLVGADEWLAIVLLVRRWLGESASLTAANACLLAPLLAARRGVFFAAKSLLGRAPSMPP